MPPQSPISRSPSLQNKPADSLEIHGTFGRDLANWLFPAFLLLILGAFLGIWKIGSQPGEENPVRALFIAVCSATGTGLASNPGLTSLNDAGQWISLSLIIAGSLISMIVGSLAVIRITRMPFKDGDVITAALIVEFIALLIGTSLLWDGDRSLFQAFYLAAGSFGNCGLFLGDIPKPGYMPLHAVVLPLTILGGIGLPVLMEIWCKLVFHAPMSNHSKTVIVASAGIYAVALIVLVALNQTGHSDLSTQPFKSQVIAGSILATESRTGGLPVVPLASVASTARWIIILLMIIGASPAGTGGGLKTTTFVELFRGTRSILAGAAPSRSLAIALTWLLTYLALALASVLLLSYVSGLEPADNVLFNAISALGNVGFTIATVPDERGLFFAYSAIALVGRMAPLMILWWMADTTHGDLAIG